MVDTDIYIQNIYKNQYWFFPSPLHLLHIHIIFTPKMFTIIDLWSMPSVVPGLAPDNLLRSCFIFKVDKNKSFKFFLFYDYKRMTTKFFLPLLFLLLDPCGKKSGPGLTSRTCNTGIMRSNIASAPVHQCSGSVTFWYGSGSEESISD